MSEYKIGQYDIKDVQAVMLEIAIEIDRICRKHDIKYILDGGTMLGAIRHKGFIPWDDDLDIAMLREDYDRFVDICKTELKPEYFLEDNYVEKDYPYDFAKMKKNNTRYVEHGNETKDIHQGVYVDIFPIDNVHLKTFRWQGRVFSMFRRARWRKIAKRTLSHEDWKKSEQRIITRVAIPFAIFPETTLRDWCNTVMRLHNGKETPYVYKLCHPNKVKPPYRRELYTNVTEVPFENVMLYVPADYDEFLRERYGDYMKWPDKKHQHPSHGIVDVKL